MSGVAGLTLELTSDPRELPVARLRVRDWLLTQTWSPEQAEEVVLALNEALTNIIRHSYRGDPCQPIIIGVQAVADPCEGDGVEVRVRDFGPQVDPASICGRDLEDVRPGGLGVHIIRSMNNSVEYQRAPGGGMLLVMRKLKTHRAVPGSCEAPQG